MTEFGQDFARFVLAGRSAQVETPWRPITIADSFPAQWDAITSEARSQVWRCSRRAAKTYGARLRTVKRSSERPGWRTLYIHHTRVIGKQQFYETGDDRDPGVREMLRLHGIPEAHHDLTELSVRLANGSFVQVVGCDNVAEVGKKLGFQWNDIIIDECQEYADEVLEVLVDKTILPTLIDRGGSLTLMGTPSDVEDGVWYRAITVPGGFTQHHWTLLDNPFIDRKNIVETMAIRGFKIDFERPENNAIIIQREIFGRQVVDPERLLYCYQPGLNDWDIGGIPLIDSPGWRFAMGVDIGGVSEDNDADAIVVIGWMLNDPEHRIWERESWEGRGDSEAFCARVVETFRKWRPMVAACGDTGGAGATKALATISKRLDGLVLTPKPTSVETSQRLLNDEFRSGRFRVDPFGRIARAAKTCLKGKHEADTMAACRYAHHGAYHYLAKPKAKEEIKDLDMQIREARHAQRRNEDRRSRDPWSHEGGWQS